MNLNHIFAEELRKIRQKKMNVTQKEAAKRMGMSTQAYARLERGQVKIKLEHLSRFSNCFKISFFELIPFRLILQKELLEDAEPVELIEASLRILKERRKE